MDTKALLTVMAALCCAWGASALAAGNPVQVTAGLSGNTVSVTGSVQEGNTARIGVLLLEKRANLDEPSPADIVYANEYELGAEKTFSFQAVLPKADLQQYVLKIGGENGLLYQRVLDGSEIPDTPDTTTSASSTVPTTGSDAQETSGSSVTSGTSAGTQPSGTDPTRACLRALLLPTAAGTAPKRGIRTRLSGASRPWLRCSSWERSSS